MHMQPYADEWNDSVKAEGTAGGCAAFPVSLDDVRSQEDTPIIDAHFKIARGWVAD